MLHLLKQVNRKLQGKYVYLETKSISQASPSW